MLSCIDEADAVRSAVANSEFAISEFDLSKFLNNAEDQHWADLTPKPLYLGPALSPVGTVS
jgi:hypothetical protein